MHNQLIHKDSRRLIDAGISKEQSPGSRSEAGFSGLSISKRLAVIVLTLAIPLNLVVIAAVWRLSEEEREAQRVSLRYTARTVSAAVDEKMGQYLALGQAISRFPSLLDDNLAAFEVEGRRAFESIPDATFVVADLGGQELLNTAARPGQRLPSRSPAAFQAQTEALQKREPVISGVRLGNVSRTWIVSVEIPVFKEGTPFRTLSIAVRSVAFFQLLNEQKLPENWLAGIIDGEGRYIARLVPGNDAQSTGQLASESWRSVRQYDGTHDIFTPEGMPIVKANVHSKATGWSIGVAVRKPFLEAAVWRTARWALIAGGSISLLSLICASFVAQSIAGALAELRSKAQALFTEAKTAPAPAGPPEIKDLWQALKLAAASRDRSEEALRDSEERLRLANEAANIGTFTVDLEAGCARYSPELAAMLGFPHVRTVTLEDAFARIHHEDVAGARAAYEAGLSGADGGRFRVDFRFVRPGGQIRWLAWAGRATFRDRPSGRVPVQIFGACIDITDRKQAEEALRRSEEQLRLSNEAGGVGAFTIDIKNGTVFYPPATAAMLGAPDLREISLEMALRRVHRDDVERLRTAYAAAIKAGADGHTKLDFRYVRVGGEVRWLSWTGRVDFLEGRSGREPFRVTGACVDITDRKRHEEQIRLLLQEVNHRSKNMLAVVQAIARQTAATAPFDFIERFTDRVGALAASQDLLTKSEWNGVKLKELLLSQLAHFRDLTGVRILIDGADMLINPAAAQAIGMAVHELATNSGKFGALSGSCGRVEISWGIELRQGAKETFVIEWRETGGPEVRSSGRRGFGTSVVTDILEGSLQGTASLAFEKTGLRWHFECPAAGFLEGKGAISRI